MQALVLGEVASFREGDAFARAASTRCSGRTRSGPPARSAARLPAGVTRVSRRVQAAPPTYASRHPRSPQGRDVLHTGDGAEVTGGERQRELVRIKTSTP